MGALSFSSSPAVLLVLALSSFSYFFFSSSFVVAVLLFSCCRFFRVMFTMAPDCFQSSNHVDHVGRLLVLAETVKLMTLPTMGAVMARVKAARISVLVCINSSISSCDQRKTSTLSSSAMTVLNEPAMALPLIILPGKESEEVSSVFVSSSSPDDDDDPSFSSLNKNVDNLLLPLSDESLLLLASLDAVLVVLSPFILSDNFLAIVVTAVVLLLPAAVGVVDDAFVLSLFPFNISRSAKASKNAISPNHAPESPPMRSSRAPGADEIAVNRRPKTLACVLPWTIKYTCFDGSP
mmetsp:Transcript_42/g.83  ORF Transcript_42/g.83 Transcript_42/m.83 type:complete len:293 (+) Transcript_42:368-1246(+)